MGPRTLSLPVCPTRHSVTHSKGISKPLHGTPAVIQSTDSKMGPNGLRPLVYTDSVSTTGRRVSTQRTFSSFFVYFSPGWTLPRCPQHSMFPPRPPKLLFRDSTRSTQVPRG